MTMLCVVTNLHIETFISCNERHDMKASSSKSKWVFALAGTAVLTMAGCGGGSSAPTLSADQQVFESLILAPSPGSYSLGWSQPGSGAPLATTHFIFSSNGQLTASPLNGPQINTEGAPANLSKTLSIPSIIPARILQNGVIYLLPGTQQKMQVSYVGSQIQIDYFGQDGSTIVNTQVRSNYSSVPLSGAIGSAPTDMVNALNVLYSNPMLLNRAATFNTGAAYVKYSVTQKGDLYQAYDCNGATTTAAVSPCFTNTTLAAALANGITSASDGVSYNASNGTTTTVGGIPVYVANNARPYVNAGGLNSSTTSYRIYFQLNGNVYTGAVIKDGTALSGNSRVDSTSASGYSTVNYFLRFNQAAIQSIQAAYQY